MSFPVSVKGIVHNTGRILLLMNPRNEYELPGGRIEIGESVSDCLKREIFEECGLDVDIVSFSGAGLFEVIPGKFVFIVAFHCSANSEAIAVSDEHRDHLWIRADDLESVNIPKFYVDLIRSSENFL